MFRRWNKPPSRRQHIYENLQVRRTIGKTAEEEVQPGRGFIHFERRIQDSSKSPAFAQHHDLDHGRELVELQRIDMDYSEIILVAASINEWRKWEFITKATESRAAIVTISAQETVCGQTVSSVSLIASSTSKPRMELLLGVASCSEWIVVLLSSNNDASQPCHRNHISRYTFELHFHWFKTQVII